MYKNVAYVFRRKRIQDVRQDKKFISVKNFPNNSFISVKKCFTKTHLLFTDSVDKAIV